MKLKKTLGLYLHIPFCEKKCGYCDFYSKVGFTDYSRFTDALMLEIEDLAPLAKDRTVDTVFIGGGTPSLLPQKMMLTLLDKLADSFDIDKNAEVTMEANPATVDKKTLKKYRRAGINRLSLGIQSADDNELRVLTRIHTFSEAEDAFMEAREAGFSNINVDLMYGIPSQTESSLFSTVEKIIEMDPEHISLYGLKIEEGTPFAARRKELALPDEDTEFRMYEDTVRHLRSVGYQQYEISNFARKGFRCRHNLKYWNEQEYLGFGPAAHSFFGGLRYANKKDVDLYMDSLESIEQTLAHREESTPVDEHDMRNEYIMLRFRLTDGLSESQYKKRFGESFSESFASRLPLYLENGFMQKNGDVYSLTVKGMYVSNYILSDLVSFHRT